MTLSVSEVFSDQFASYVEIDDNATLPGIASVFSEYTPGLPFHLSNIKPLLSKIITSFYIGPKELAQAQSKLACRYPGAVVQFI